MALTNIEYGSLASSEIMNKNFSYLDNKISDVSDSIMTSISSILSNIATINTRLSDMSEAMQEDSKDLSAKLEDYKSKTKILVNNASMVPNWGSCRALGSVNNLRLDKNGYLLLLPATTASGDISVNGVNLKMKTRVNNYDNSSDLLVVPVKAGDIVYCSVNLTNAYFLPALNITINDF